jgi:hypothetical protein
MVGFGDGECHPSSLFASGLFFSLQHTGSCFTRGLALASAPILQAAPSSMQNAAQGDKLHSPADDDTAVVTSERTPLKHWKAFSKLYTSGTWGSRLRDTAGQRGALFPCAVSSNSRLTCGSAHRRTVPRWVQQVTCYSVHTPRSSGWRLPRWSRTHRSSTCLRTREARHGTRSRSRPPVWPPLPLLRRLCTDRL